MAVILTPTDFADFATAILNANNNDIIRGEQVGSPFQGANNRNLDLGALDPLTVEGETGVAADVVIDVQSAANSRAWLFDNGESNNVILKDLRITNGNIAGNGGGICIDDSSPLLQNLIIDFCVSTFPEAGALYIVGTAPLGNTVNTTFTDLVIENNSGYPGGIKFYNYTLVTLNNCIIRNNTSPTHAGGFYVIEYARTVWNNCQIYGNTAALSGGAGLVFGHDTQAVTMNNCLIYGNTATTGSGGGFWVAATDTAVFLNNCTIANNHAGDDGGAIKTTAGNPTDVYLTDCILWGNTSVNPGHSLDEAAPSGAIDLKYCCYQNGLNDNVGNVVVDGNSFTTNPLHVAGPLGNYYISQIAAGQGADSPCLDTGSNTAVFFGLNTRTTRTDEVTDAGIVDVGWHYEVSAAPVGPAPMLQTVTT